MYDAPVVPYVIKIPSVITPEKNMIPPIEKNKRPRCKSHKISAYHQKINHDFSIPNKFDKILSRFITKNGSDNTKWD